MYFCPLVGSIKLATIVNLPSGSPSSLSFIKNPVQDCAAMRCYQSAVSLLNRTTVAAPSMRTSSPNPGKGAMLGKWQLQVCWCQRHASQYSPCPAWRPGWLSQHRNIQAGAQSRASREAHEKSPDWLVMSMGAQNGGN